ncbi:MAG TPA: biotin--[acetyl-CoA-carboxylase] ligase [Candidatus Limnocylindrales bacterium]|nr:biotin--[acetyl-CoA-carboxylase] ligase [Candidatus Limnocylindrales bacterium]
MPRLVLLAHPAVRSAVAREVGRDIEYHERIESTQSRARELARDGATRGIVVADEQTAGRGTADRTWLAAKGTGLLASWIVRPAPAAPALFAALAGLAVARALDALGCDGARLKWPNDVELDGRKVAGVLAHGTSDGTGGSIVLGIGVNVHQRASDLPAEIRDTATSLAISSRPVDRLALLARITAELDRLADPSALIAARDEWQRRSSVIGESVDVTVPGRVSFTGTATSIDEEGALLVRAGTHVERIVAGEVRRRG